MSSALAEAIPQHEALPPALPVARDAPLVFAGENRDFRRLVTRGAVLELFTAGFYRFWLATKIRRMLWSDTSLDGEDFTYHGTGRELFLGFLLAMAILAPLYFGYFLIGIEAERLKAFASVPFFLFLVAFQQFAIYRSRRYRLHRTTWRGLRFGMTGSGWGYAGRAMLWGALGILSLGLSLPWGKAALERYKMRHLFFGDLPGRFEGTGGQFFRRAWLLWLAPFLVLAIGGAAVAGAASGSKEAAGIVGAVLGLMALIAAPFWYAAYRTTEWRWWIEGLRLGDIRATVQLSALSFFRIYWTLIGVSYGLMMVGGAIVGALFWLSGVGGELATGKAAPTIPLIVGGALTYLGTLLAIGVATRIYTIQRVWKTICGATLVRNVHLADDVVARPGTGSALGEGFADSLDVLNF